MIKIQDITDLDLVVIPVVDDPGGPRVIIGDVLLSFETTAALRNYLSKWLDVTRREQKTPSNRNYP